MYQRVFKYSTELVFTLYFYMNNYCAGVPRTLLFNPGEAGGNLVDGTFPAKFSKVLSLAERPRHQSAKGPVPNNIQTNLSYQTPNYGSIK